MNTLKHSLQALFLVLLISCGNEPEEQKVLTSNSAFEAEIEDIDHRVSSIDKNNDLRQFFFDREDINDLYAENPFWKEIRIYMDENGLKKVQMTGKTEVEQEVLYFDQDQKLIYATKSEPEAGTEEYYFILERLVIANSTLDTAYNHKNENAKLTSIDLVSEAGKFRKYVARKNLKP